MRGDWNKFYPFQSHQTKGHALHDASGEGDYQNIEGG